MSVEQVIDVIYKADLVVPVKKRFMVETLTTILINFDSEGIDE